MKSAAVYPTLNFVDKQGNRIPQPHCRIVFEDGSTLATNWYFDEPEDAGRFIDLLMKKKHSNQYFPY